MSQTRHNTGFTDDLFYNRGSLQRPTLDGRLLTWNCNADDSVLNKYVDTAHLCENKLFDCDIIPTPLPTPDPSKGSLPYNNRYTMERYDDQGKAYRYIKIALTSIIQRVDGHSVQDKVT